MQNLRSKNIRSKKLLRGAKDQSCVRCGSRGTVAAHYQGYRSQSFGKGMGIKPHDLCIADLCMNCHKLFDSYQGGFAADKFERKIELSERFLYYIMLTLIRRFEQGILHD